MSILQAITFLSLVLFLNANVSVIGPLSLVMNLKTVENAVMVVATFTEDNIEYRIGYVLTQIEDKGYHLVEPKIFNDVKLVVNGTTSYQIKTDLTKPKYILEVAHDIHLLNTSNNYMLSISIDEISDLPSKSNGTLLNTSNSYTNGRAITTFSINTKKSFLLVNFHLVQGNTSQINEVPSLLFKYSNLGQTEVPKQHSFNEKFGASIFFGSLTVGFAEIFKDKNDTDSVTYIIALFNKKGISKDTDVNTLYALDSAIDKKEFIGNCTGNKMEGNLTQ